MKWRLIASFAAIALLFLGSAFFQYGKIGEVRQSMNLQKQGMEKRIAAVKINQFLQELSSIEDELERENDAEQIKPFRQIHAALTKELAKLDFSDSSAAQEDLQALRTKSTDYGADVEEMTAQLQDKNADPLIVKARLDELHTLVTADNQNMQDISNRLSVAADRKASGAQVGSFKLLQETLAVSEIAAVLVLLITVAVAFVLVRSFAASIGRLQQAVGALAQGDLRDRIGSDRKDELGRLSQQFDLMVDKVHGMLERSKGIAVSLLDNSGEFRAAATVTARANEEIIKSIHGIADGAEKQNELSDETRELIEGLVAEVDGIGLLAGDMMELRQLAEQKTGRGLEAVRELQQVSRATSGKVDVMYRELDNLSSHTQKISGITKSMIEVSSQTQILALNASIEAAQAGASGRGFAVIAEEVRKLSIQSKESSAVIAMLIKQLQDGMEGFRAAMEDNRRLLHAQNEQTGLTIGSFEAIGASMVRISSGIETLYGQVDRTRSSCGQLRDSAVQVSDIAESTAAAAQQVLASGTLQDEEIRKIAGQALQIHDMSRSLSGEISLFLLQEATDNSSEQKQEGTTGKAA
ncbi:methyl-accepting chemotaxis protein [Paenibacillaceae bacterium GAS479]|nr:methyl-accepting chemotaxis protein [Paenibacillaceae bacterium GAS479]